MKKYILVCAVLLGIIVKGECSYKVSSDWKATRSSVTCTVDTDVPIATGAIRVTDIIVTSGTAAVSQLQLFNTTGTVSGGVSRSSSSIYDIDTTADVFPVWKDFYKGVRYTKTGTGCVDIKWDFIGIPPRTLEKIGILE